jgi:hypothetical protein
MKLKTAALIAIIGNSLTIVFWLLQIWGIVVLNEKLQFQITQSATNLLSNGTVVLFLIIFFTKAK